MNQNTQTADDSRKREENPADTDQAARRFGTKCMCWGIAVVGGTLLGSIAFAAALATDTLGFNPDLRMFLIFIVLCAIATGSSLFVIGGVDRLLEPFRARDRRDDVRHDDALARFEQIEGAIEVIAEHLPENQQLHHWRGHNAAVLRGFVEQTGTDGLRPRAPHLDIVRPGN